MAEVKPGDTFVVLIRGPVKFSTQKWAIYKG